MCRGGYLWWEALLSPAHDSVPIISGHAPSATTRARGPTPDNAQGRLADRPSGGLVRTWREMRGNHCSSITPLIFINIMEKQA